MPLAKCVRCQQLFNKEQSPICPGCEPKEQADYDKIRAVMDSESGLSARELAERAGVDVQIVLRMVDGGLIHNLGQGDKAVCGRCGAPAISLSKRLCQTCLEKLNAEVLREQARPRPGARAPIRSKTAHKTFEEKRRGS